jgi:L-ascorbate metabolism protein UlaG (beta-lactamase superfamily)
MSLMHEGPVQRPEDAPDPGRSPTDIVRRMKITLVRHATLLIDYAGRRLMVDPMLDPAGARGPVRGTPNELPNPLLGLPMGADEAAAGVQAVLLTHTHVDHMDAAGVTALAPGGAPWICQPEDVEDLTDIGLRDVRPVPADAPLEWDGITIHRTGGRHGREEAAVQGLGPVSGFVLSANSEPTLYVAGDTVWCPEVEEAIAAHYPGWIVVNAGGARFLQGGTITMEADDVIAVAGAAPAARVVAVHMEAINHCLETRADLAARVGSAGLADRVAIPADGETLVS